MDAEELQALMQAFSDEFDQVCADPTKLRPAVRGYSVEATLERTVDIANNARHIYIHTRLSEELFRRKAAESEAGADPS